MKKLSALFVVVVFAQMACQKNKASKVAEKTESVQSDTNANAVKIIDIDAKEVTKDFNSWYEYMYSHISLSKDFIPRNADGQVIKKVDFLDQLISGNYVPLETAVQNGQSVYQLFPFTSKDQYIVSTITQMAATSKKHYQLEGMPLPDFKFSDINGKTYSKASLLGKTLVLKCWFIRCVACVKEFPVLNQLVDDHKGDSNLVFISLALDTQEKLQQFLTTKPFSFAVVPNMETYMTEQLHVTEYPTHFLVGNDGHIKKVVGTIEELLPYIKHIPTTKII
jgi:peroxiredoxin